ncbi:unnamed protein product [Brassica rapa]|uniref:NYN domain-containing protein n=1 Tax=Brassica campestris TaxID=3711 RepID=A0A3P6BQZ9_BRACM|nr:unnamed protein product [Brassica rapa]VDD01265.1 unnamed protein product [Brassica rapa]
MDPIGISRTLKDLGSKKSVTSVCVMLDTDDIAIPEANEIQEKVRFHLRQEGYHGMVSTKAFYSDKNQFSDKQAEEYCNYGMKPIFLRGDRGSRIRMMLVDMVFWVETRSNEPVYVLVISKDENLEKDAMFSTVRQLLGEHRDFHLTVAQPDTILGFPS